MPLTDPWLPVAPVPLGRDAATLAVYRYTPGSPGTYLLLDNVRCLAIERREGPEPSSARFRYVFTQTSADAQAPQSLEQALDTSFTGSKTIQPGDRLVVKAARPDGGIECLFDGYAFDFGGQIGEGSETAEVGALGVEVRARDTPLPGAIVRKADSVATAGADVPTDLPARFNPRGAPNCTGDSNRSTNTAGKEYPVFVDPAVIRSTDVRFPWTLPRAARYLCYTANDEALVQNPAATDLDNLVGREPKDGTAFDPADPATYTTSDLYASDHPVSGKDWPTAVHELIRPRGFGQHWKLTTFGGDPQTALSVWHPQTGTVKDLWLQARGAVLDLTLTNLAGAQFNRDLAGLANHFRVQGAPGRYEVSVVLAPAFPMASGDKADANLKTYASADIEPGTAKWDAYRTFVFDETGEGHYVNWSATKLTDVPSLDGVLGAPSGGVTKYTVRRRPGVGELVTRDAAGKPLRYRVAVSRDYTGPYPAVWDGTGTWQTVDSPPPLLHDRLGIRLSAANPNKWNIGKIEGSSDFPDGMVKVVEALAASSTTNREFFVRLTCVVEGDLVVEGEANRRSASPLPWDVTRVIDARDRFEHREVAANSEFNDTADPVIDRDDLPAAIAEAEAMRDAQDSGVLQGEAVIPRLTTYYGIGDRIRSIQGRGLGFRTDGGGADNAPIYPVVVGVRWELEGGQRTVLSLSDGIVMRGRTR